LAMSAAGPVLRSASSTRCSYRAGGVLLRFSITAIPTMF